jgi:diphosphomevalonate decarboxylase
VIWCNNELWLFLLQAITGKDFETFADITMKDSNQFHAVCLDTFPPNVYMNDTSHTIVNLIHAYNSASGKTKVGTIYIYNRFV